MADKELRLQEAVTEAVDQNDKVHEDYESDREGGEFKEDVVARCSYD